MQQNARGVCKNVSLEKGKILFDNWSQNLVTLVLKKITPTETSLHSFQYDISSFNTVRTGKKTDAILSESNYPMSCFEISNKDMLFGHFTTVVNKNG